MSAKSRTLVIGRRLSGKTSWCLREAKRLLRRKGGVFIYVSNSPDSLRLCAREMGIDRSASTFSMSSLSTSSMSSSSSSSSASSSSVLSSSTFRYTSCLYPNVECWLFDHDTKPMTKDFHMTKKRTTVIIWDDMNPPISWHSFDAYWTLSCCHFFFVVQRIRSVPLTMLNPDRVVTFRSTYADVPLKVRHQRHRHRLRVCPTPCSDRIPMVKPPRYPYVVKKPLNPYIPWCFSTACKHWSREDYCCGCMKTKCECNRMMEQRRVLISQRIKPLVGRDVLNIVFAYEADVCPQCGVHIPENPMYPRCSRRTRLVQNDNYTISFFNI